MVARHIQQFRLIAWSTIFDRVIAWQSPEIAVKNCEFLNQNMFENANSFKFSFSYDLMFSCWHCEPDERPSFMHINRRLDNFITNFSPDDIIDLKYLEKSKNQNEREDSYLKPFSSAQT